MKNSNPFFSLVPVLVLSLSLAEADLQDSSRAWMKRCYEADVILEQKNFKKRKKKKEEEEGRGGRGRGRRRIGAVS